MVDFVWCSVFTWSEAATFLIKDECSKRGGMSKATHARRVCGVVYIIPRVKQDYMLTPRMRFFFSVCSE